MWPAHVTEILGGDLAVAFAYCTPAGGTVVLPVTTLGMFDASAATVTTSTSLGLWKKLTRIERNDHVALAYHARDHGLASSPHFLLVQGRATFPREPDRAWLDSEEVGASWDSRIPPRKYGRLRGWFVREYQDARVPITVHVERIVAWPDSAATGEPDVYGTLPATIEPAAQVPPENGTEPRIAPSKYRRRLRKARHRLLGYVGADGFPFVIPVDLALDGRSLRVDAPHPVPGHRRAGMLAHRFEPKLVGQVVVSFTGWLEADGRRGSFAPHTLAGYELPPSKLLYTAAGGLTAKLGYRAAVKAGHVKNGVWQGAPADG